MQRTTQECKSKVHNTLYSTLLHYLHQNIYPVPRPLRTWARPDKPVLFTFSSFCADSLDSLRDENSESSKDIKARSIGGDHWLDGSRGLIKTKVYPTESNINTTRTKKIHTLLINIIYIYHDQSRHQRIEERPEICGRRRSCWGSKFRSTCKTIGWICWDSIAAGKKLQTQLCLCISYIYNIYIHTSISTHLAPTISLAYHVLT